MKPTTEAKEGKMPIKEVKKGRKPKKKAEE